MKIFKNILRLCAAAIIALPMAGCGQDELVKPSALLSESSLTFDAIGAEPQTLTVASDEAWFIDVDADWITVDPMSGTNTVDVTVTVTDNVKNGAMDAPREGTLTIANNRGYSIRTVIYQEGDNYLGVEEMPISKIFTLDDGLFAKVAEAQVVALTSDGFVATDESASIYVSYKGEIAIGDKVSLAGEKVTLYGNAALEAGGVTVKSNAEVTRPEPVDLLSNLDPSKANVVTYVTVEAGLLGHELKFEQSLPVAIKLLDPRAGVVDIESVNMHNISVKAYVLGLSDGELTLAVTDVQDNGINDSLNAYFYDDFSWMKSYIEASGVRVDDSVGDNNSSGEAPNLRSNDALSKLLDALTDRGYEDLNPKNKVIYAQKYYWKFGKTSTATVNNNNGMILPKQDFKGDELINVDLDFDWAAHMTGSGNIDKVQIVVELTGKGFFDNGTQISDPFVTTQEKGHLEWQHATVTAKGVNNTTRFIIRPAEYASVTPDQQRWHLDNIKIADSDIPYSDPVYAKVIVSDDVITFEGTPDKPYELKIESDNPWTLTKGSDADWLSLDVIEGPAGEETTVKITCEPSTSSKLRHAVITLASADTRKNIHVVQSAAGQELDSFISVSTGNAMSAVADENTIKMTVQANVEFESSTDVDWLTIVPKTRALVTWSDVEVNVAANKASSPRVGHVIFSNAEKNIQSVVTVTQEAFSRGTGYLPVIWHLGDNINFSQTFPESGKVMPVENDGYIQYVPYDVAGTDANKKYKLDVSGNNPRVTGPWPGDYWYFCSNAPAKAGDEVTISFETRTSGTGHKFWRLEFKDGEEWKVAGTPLTTSEPGEAITYTHAMNADGSTNVFVNTTVTYSKDTEIHEFRFVCAANWQANGKGALKVRNGGSARLSVTDANDSDKQPKIQSGDGSRVLFEDDFRWMTPLIKEYNKTASKPIGKSVEDNDPGAEAPNGYGAAVSIITGFYEKGYVDIHPEWKVMYPQDAYWKMGKTCDKKVETNGKYNVTGIVLPDFLAKNKASKVKVAFNWACHRRVLNEGKENETKETDPVKIVVEVIKNLNYATDASKAATYDVVSTSSAFETLQPVDKMEWQTASVVLEGISEGDRILIRPENMKPAKSTVNRWYIDNIKVTEAK